MSNRDPSTQDSLAAVSALGEPNRRALYDYVVAAGDWVGRDQAADATELQRGVTAHHLDRLAADGLLEVDFQRLSGRSGPGAGRPAKVYRRATYDIAVTLPPRDYQLAGALLADAVALAQSNGIAVEVAIDTVTKEAGRRLGRDMKQRMGGGQTAESAHRATIEVLSEQGFEPDEHEDGTIELSNCPFHALAEQQTELICGMNHCLIDTALTELDAGDLQARLQPDPNACCVRLYRT